jgi:ribosomal protein L19
MHASLADPNINLLHAVRDHHARLLDKDSRRQLFDDKLQLGQVVMIRRRVCASKPQQQMFFGVLIEKSGKDLQAYIRLRNIIMQTGVEMKVPVFSPLMDEIKIISEPAVKVIGPNLLGVRKSPEDLARFINPLLFTDKGRMIFSRSLRESPSQLANLVNGNTSALEPGKHHGLKKAASSA